MTRVSFVVACVAFPSATLLSCEARDWQSNNLDSLASMLLSASPIVAVRVPKMSARHAHARLEDDELLAFQKELAKLAGDDRNSDLAQTKEPVDIDPVLMGTTSKMTGEAARRSKEKKKTSSSIFSSPFGGSMDPLSMALNPFAALTGLGGFSAVDDSILDSVRDAIRDNMEAQNELGVNPSIGSPSTRSSSSITMNGHTTTTSQLSVPIEAENGAKWSAQVETQNGDVSWPIVLNSPSGKSLSLFESRTSPTSQDGVIDVEAF